MSKSVERRTCATAPRWATDTGSRPIDGILPRLEGVKQTAPDRWLARCPAHEDRSPSLSLRECDDHTLLVRCYAGCDTRKVLHVIGLELRDLFVRRVADRARIHDDRRLPLRDCLTVIQGEVMVVLVAAADLKAGKALSEGDHARLLVAVSRIRAAMIAAGVRT